MRETVGWGRELLAGNGIVLDYSIGRFVADAEALYSRPRRGRHRRLRLTTARPFPVAVFL